MRSSRRPCLEENVFDTEHLLPRWSREEESDGRIAHNCAANVAETREENKKKVKRMKRNEKKLWPARQKYVDDSSTLLQLEINLANRQGSSRVT